MLRIVIPILLYLVGSARLQEVVTIANDFETVAIIGNYSTDITVAVHSKKAYVIHYRKSTSVFPYTIFSTSSEANVDYPVFILVTQQKEATSWEIPFLVDSRDGMLSYVNVSRTLCHNNINRISHLPSSMIYNYDVHNIGFYKHITVAISTVNKYPTNVTIRVDEEPNFYVTENKTYSVIISPSQPKYFYYKYEENDSKFESNIILDVDSTDQTCLTVSIQNATCPVFDLNEDITYEGRYETVNTKGGVIIKKHKYPRGFFIVFVAKADNYDCDGKHSLIPLQSVGSNVRPSNHTSVVMFRIKTDITKIDYLKYTFLTIGITLMLCVLFGSVAIISLQIQRRKRRIVIVQAEDNVRLLNEIPEEDREALAQGEGAPLSQAQGDEQGEGEGTPLLRQFLHNIFNLPQETVEVYHDAASVAGNSNYQSCVTNGTNDQNDLENSLTLKKNRLKLSRPTLNDLVIKKPKIIYRESMNYCLNALTVGIFYGIPVVQLVIIHQKLLDETGNLDICYYNFLCAHPYLSLNDYNHVLSNVGYIFLGLLFLIITLVKELRMPYDKNCGIPKQYGIFYAMGVALTMEGILSGCYHICPNQSNFQFDTSFMYIMAVLCIVKLYQNRHPGINANAYLTFLMLAITVLIAMVGILDGHLWIWVVVIILFILLCMAVAIKVYYLNQLRLGLSLFYDSIRDEGLQVALSPVRNTWRNCLIGAVVINIVLAVTTGTLFYKFNMGFGTFLLCLLLANAVMYTAFYVVIKFSISRHREPAEKPTLESMCYLLLAFTTWIIAVIYFLHNSSEWMLSPAQSRQRNSHCQVMDFYDNHDIWHLTSAFALFFSFMLLLTVDDNLVYTERDEILAF